MMEKYNSQKIETKWRKFWEKNGTFQTNLGKAKNPYYNLMMFPYPSAEGLHVGNVYAFTGSDIHGRFRRMQGKDVFEPIGFDAFGIHSENFAIKKGIHPKILTKKNTDNFRLQLKNLGCLFDWRYEVDTSRPEYYKWTQWLFIQLFKAGLAYRKKAPVDWCPSCKTVLADEQVIGGKCERCDSQVIQQENEQWFFGITKYAERLLKNLEVIDWSEKTKITQKNWIGKSEGATIEFKIKDSELSVPVFTTRADTLFGCTYFVVAPEHPIIKSLESKIQNFASVNNYIKESRKKTEIERISEIKEKTGVELGGIKAINSGNQREISIWVADYVLFHYGTGAVMAVPCHDQRDFEFAKRYNLPMIEVIRPESGRGCINPDGSFGMAYEGEGILVNSGRFDGMDSGAAREKIVEWIGAKNLAQKSVYYKLRDWLISRQRYWGSPIPIIYCEKCGTVPVPEKDLPVELPYVKDFRPEGTGKSPLTSIKNFVETDCPKCKGPAKRETDVSDTFLDSSWYFLRYPSTDFKKKPLDKKITKKWLPVDMYIGGQEHAVLHLMYSRFVTMVLKDLGFVDFEEPFEKFRAHGLLTKSGAKMSKSKGNVVNPDEYYKEFGADTLRTYLMFLGPFEQGGDWQDKGIMGIKRFLEKVWGLKEKTVKGKVNPDLEIFVNRTIKKVTEDLENLRYNTAISALMIFTNKMSESGCNLAENNFRTLLLLLSPFAPHLTEELWQQIGSKESIHKQKWPKYDSKFIKEKTANLIIQINGKVREILKTDSDITEEQARELAISREKIKKWIEGKNIKKVIFVPGKLINIVV
ncbi:MAG: leucine--tRNA ligase [Patescibacteria group bacterium]